MRNKQKIKKLACLLAGLVMVCCSFTSHAKEENIKVSDKEYILTIQDRINLFIGNNTPVSGKVGSKVFLTYTVAEVSENTAAQNGVVASLDNTLVYPYTEGGSLEYSGSSLFDEGYTYVFRFERTKDGFEYQGIKLKGEEEQHVRFRKQVGEKDGAFQYFGIWVGGAMDTCLNAVLTHVRCYDEKGNDLGIYPSKVIDDARMHQELFNTHLRVDHSYDFSFENQWNLVISNQKPVTDSKAVVYMEYEVGKVAKDESNQAGLIVSGAPKENYPFQFNRGSLHYNARALDTKNSQLLKPGGKYLICFAKEEKGFVGLVQCTVDGQTEFYSFTGVTGEYDPAYGYYSLWIGDAKQVSCEIKNFKCYDSKGNSLGVQFNKNGIVPTYKGELEDYSKSLATYYCKTNQTFLVLQDDKTAYKQVEGDKKEAAYRIEDGMLTMNYKDGKEGYTYLDVVIVDDKENRYVRLKPQTVRFVLDGEVIEKEATAENGFRVEPLEVKDKKNNKFEGWKLANGEKFELQSVITETITLYPVWEKGEEIEYATGNSISQIKNERIAMFIALGVSNVVVISAVVCSVVLVKRRKRKL